VICNIKFIYPNGYNLIIIGTNLIHLLEVMIMALTTLDERTRPCRQILVKRTPRVSPVVKAIGHVAFFACLAYGSYLYGMAKSKPGIARQRAAQTANKFEHYGPRTDSTVEQHAEFKSALEYHNEREAAWATALRTNRLPTPGP
jgi:hypothetical protein